MLSFLKQLNTNLNLFQALSKKLKSLISYLKQRKLFTGFIILVSFGAVILGIKHLVPVPLEKRYQLATVSRQDLKKTVTSSGTIESQTQLELKFQTSGQLAWVNVHEGDEVKKWQALAGLDPRELQKTLEKYLRDYSKERNDFDEAQLETYRNQELTDTVKRILEKNQWDLEKAVLDVELRDLALKYATLLSPIDGLVTHIDVPVSGVNITPAAAVFTVVDPVNLNFEAEIDETDIGFLAVKQPAELSLDAYLDETFPVTVDSIDFNSTLASDGSTVFIAKFKLDNPDRTKFRLGMNGEVKITVAEKTDALTVPIEAVIEQETDVVKVIKDNQVIEQPVQLGLITDDQAEVLSGLEPGQTIVVSEKLKK
jgi:RND family efflux transporter MFP subunit